MAVTMSQAFFLGLIFETLFFGVFLPIFVFFMYLQWQRRKESKTPGGIMVLSFSIILFLFISTQWLLLVLACYDIYMNVDRGPDTESAFSDWSDIGSVILFALYEVQVWVGDVILIYRLYHVSRTNIRHIIFPCITCVATLVCAGNLLHSIAIEDVDDPASLARIRTWGTATFTMTLTENTYCASMIAFHIWRMERDVRYFIRSNLGRVLRIFIESAALWIAFMFITFFLFLANTPVWLTMLHLTNPVLGICFCAMTARLFLLTGDESISGDKTSGPPIFARPP